MRNIKPYPHYEINVEDRSIYEPITVDFLPIHRPVFAMKCQKGPVGVPMWIDRYTTAATVFGDQTFNMNNVNYFSRESYFLTKTFQDNGAFIVRLVEASAQTSFIILYASVKTKPLPQYQYDSLGYRMVDDEGNWLPLLDDDDEPVMETGIEITWSLETALPVVGGETIEIDKITPLTSIDPADSLSKTKYPMFAFKATSPGAWGNDVGFSLFYDSNNNDELRVNRVGSLYYTLAPIEKKFGESTATPIRDVYSNTFNNFVMKPDVVDQATQLMVSCQDILEKAYTEQFPLPYKIYSYNANFKAIGDLCVPKEVADHPEITDGWMVNVVNGKDLDNKPYDHVLVKYATTSATLTRDVLIYMANGTDGDLSNDAIEELYRQFLELAINPDIVDKPRYPFTHIFDTGYSLETKYKIINFLDTRDDMKVYIATQDCNLPMFTKMEDESIGSALRARALLMRESIVKGTSACRATIFQQCGLMPDNYKGIMPTTLWAAMKHAEYQNRDFMDREPKGLPYSDIRIFKSWNWIHASDDAKSRSWDNGLNYSQYYTMKALHYASIRSVYKYDTSILVDDTFTDALVYTKHEVRQSWAKFAGVTIPAAILQEQIRKDLTERLTRLFNGKFTFVVTVYQTTEEVKIGYIQHVLIEITSPATNRVWDVDIVVKREGYEPGT